MSRYPGHLFVSNTSAVIDLGCWWGVSDFQIAMKSPIDFLLCFWKFLLVDSKLIG